MNTYLLDILALGAVLSGILVITSKNPVISVLFLISVFVNAAGYLLLLGVGFVGISYLIVYVGAIAILFLFVIMMLNISVREITSIGTDYTKNLPLGLIIGTLFFLEILSVMPYMISMSFRVDLTNHINALLLGVNTTSVNPTIQMSFANAGADERFSNYLQIEALGQGLYTFGSLWLLVTSLVLLLAMLGPIVLCLRSVRTIK